MTQQRIGIYPGTFDPITNGHADIIRRAIRVVDRLVVGVARNDGKGPLFATDERIETVLLMASDRFQFISSRFVKEIGALGGDVSHFVSPRVAVRLLERFANSRTRVRRRAAAD